MHPELRMLLELQEQSPSSCLCCAWTYGKHVPTFILDLGRATLDEAMTHQPHSASTPAVHACLDHSFASTNPHCKPPTPRESFLSRVSFAPALLARIIHRAHPHIIVGSSSRSSRLIAHRSPSRELPHCTLVTHVSVMGLHREDRFVG